MRSASVLLALLAVVAAATHHVVFVSIALPGHLTPLLGFAEELLHRGWHVSVVSTDEARAFVDETTGAWPDLAESARQRLTFFSLGDMQAVERRATRNDSLVLLRTEDVFLEASSMVDFQEGAFVIFDWLTDMWRPMYDTLLPLLRTMHPAPSIVVADIMTNAAQDAAETLGLPLVLHNADAINVLSPDVLPADDTVPGLFELISQADLGLRGRIVYPPARLAGRAVVALKMDARTQPLRASRNLPPRSMLERTAGYLITHSLLAGLEHARALPPMLQLLGPCLPRHWRSLGAHNITALPRTLREWLTTSIDVNELAAMVPPTNTTISMTAKATEDDEDHDVDARLAPPNATCLVLVNMGTIARLNAAQTSAFYFALRALPTPLSECGAFKIMWKLRAEAQMHLRAALGQQHAEPLDVNATGVPQRVSELPGEGLLIERGRVALRVSKWLPSQLALFQLPHLRLFVTHCGINSVHEALFFNIPLLCIPLFADQGDMAVRVFDSGAGLMVSKDNITTASLSWALRTLLDDETSYAATNALNSRAGTVSSKPVASFRRAAARMASLMRAAGGSERGADLIAHVAAHGADSWLLPGQAVARDHAGGPSVVAPVMRVNDAWWIASGVDVAFVYATVVAVFAWCARRVYR